MKIGMVTPHYNYLNRGAEIFTKNVASNLRVRGHDVDILTIDEGRPTLHNGVGGICRAIASRTSMGGFFRKFIGVEPDISHFAYFLQESNSFKDKDYDFLWNNGEMFGALLCYKIRQRFGIDFIVTFHGNESMMMITEALLKPKLFAVLSPKYLDFIKGKVSGNIRCIPNGVDIDRFNPGNKKDMGFNLPRPWYISTSAHEPQKHVDQAIDYVAGRDGSLIITSSGSMTNELRNRCKLRLKGRHMFLGVVESDQIPILLASSDSYITCSTSEGHSLAILEALASGLKIVAPNADENIRWTIGSNDRSYAERFSWGKVVDRYMEGIA